MNPKSTAAALCLLLMAGCSKPTNLPPAMKDPGESSPAPAAPATLVKPARFYILEAGQAKSVQLSSAQTSAEVSHAVTSDQPTFREEAPAKKNVRQVAGPENPVADSEVPALLQKLAARLDDYQEPTPPAEVPAVLGVAASGFYVYNIGPVPGTGHGLGPYNRVYVLLRVEGVWSANQICSDRSEFVGIFEAPDRLPIVSCSSLVGNGRPLTLAAVYIGPDEIARFDGLAEAGVELVPGSGVYPELRAYRWVSWTPQYGLRGLNLTERLTYSRTPGKGYDVIARAWQENWQYHYARFDAFLQEGNLVQAALEMAAPPSEGLQAYLDRVAPGIREKLGARRNPRLVKDRFYMQGGDGDQAVWYWFEFAPEGRIKAVGSQSTAPEE